MTKNEQIACLYEVKAKELFRQEKYDELYELFLKNRVYFVRNRLAEEEIVKTLLLQNDETQLSYYLGETNDFAEIRRIKSSYEVPPELLVNNLKKSSLIYQSLKDVEKINIVPRHINDSNNNTGIFLRNIIGKSLLLLVSKKYAVNRVSGLFKRYELKENELNDLLKILISNYLYAIDFQEPSDQSRVGYSFNGEDAGSADIIIKIDNEDFIIEPLWLTSMNKEYLDLHINKVYKYSVCGNYYFIVIYYKGKKFESFNKNLFGYLDNINNKKAEDKHKYISNHELIKIQQEDSNSSMSIIKLKMTDSEMYVFSVNMAPEK